MTPRQTAGRPETTTVAVRVRAGARRTQVGGRYDGPYGPAIVVRVTAPPVEGRATEAVLVEVARALRVRRRDLALRAGTMSRDKLITVADPPADLESRVTQLRDGPR